MIQLTSNIIAVEVPNDAMDILLIHGNTILAYFHPNYVRIDLSCQAEYIIGVTPLSYETWCIQVFFNEYGNGNINHGDDIAILIESKGLDINKKYAIIKIENL